MAYCKDKIIWYDPFALKSKRPKTEIARMLLDAFDRMEEMERCKEETIYTSS